MTWLFERPLPIGFVSAVMVAAFLAALIHTGQGRLIYMALAALLIGIGLLVVERVVVTPFEEVKTTLNNIARDLEQNDADAIVSHISQVAPKLREEAKSRLRQVEVYEVSIKSNLKVTFAETRGREVAQAGFNAVILLSDKAGQYGRRPHPRFVLVNFRKEGEDWKISGYELRDPREGIGR